MKEFLSPHARSVLLGNRLCTATNRDGSRCGNASMLGAFICAMHGGKSPLSKQAARERLMMLVEPALDALLRALRTGPPCPACGRSDADRDPVTVRAAQLVLDRCGYHPTMTVRMEPAPNPFANLTTAELIEKLEGMLAQARELQAIEQRQPEAEEGFVIDLDVPDETRAIPGGDCTISEEPLENTQENEATEAGVPAGEPEELS